jgi:hypothetical protein
MTARARSSTRLINTRLGFDIRAFRALPLIVLAECQHRDSMRGDPDDPAAEADLSV